MTDEQEDDYEDEDDIPLSLLAQQLRVDQSFLQNVDIEPPTEENTGNWERDLISSFVKPIAEESNKQFVHDDEEKHVDVPGSNLSHREVLDMVIKLKHSSQRLELSPTGSRAGKFNQKKKVEQRCSHMQLTLDTFFQKHLGNLDRES